ncbi:MAG: Adaptor for signal transduction [Alyxoria varia]|nr:MAG: Adaptor for signal transduction [Alyxoria varia]
MASHDALYQDDSDSLADDEFERSASPTLPSQYESSSPTNSEVQSTEHTPTTYTHSTTTAISPRGLITSWSAEQCADFVASLGLEKYRDNIIREEINGEAIVEVQQTDLKDIGITSVGHRLTILKGVYEVKLKQNIPIESDDYVPLSADANAPDGHATQDDVARIINQIKLRDDRLRHAESELFTMRDELLRIQEEQKKLREETLPMIRMAKDRTQALPTPDGVDQHHVIPSPSPNNSQTEPPKSGGTIARKWSKKGLFLHGSGNSNNKIPSPTIHEESSLDPSAAAMAASNHLTSSFNSSQNQGSPQFSQQPSPTSPPYAMQQHQPRGFSRAERFADTNGADNSSSGGPWVHSNASTTTADRVERNASNNQSSGASITGRRPVNQTPPGPLNTAAASTTNLGNTAPTPGGSAQTQTGGGGSNENDPGGFMKSFRVSMEEPCHKVLPVALKKYQIADDWRQYSLYIVHGDQERCLGLDERPLILFKQLANEGKRPMFMLRKHAAPQDGWAQSRVDAAGAGSTSGGTGSGGSGGSGGGGQGGGGGQPNGNSAMGGWANSSSLNVPGNQQGGGGGRVQSYASTYAGSTIGGTSQSQLPGGVL